MSQDKSQERHEKHLRYRREYYQKNKEYIRARDNASYKKRMEEHPEKAQHLRDKTREYRRRYMEREKNIDYGSLADNPDRDAILEAVAMEQEEAD